MKPHFVSATILVVDDDPDIQEVLSDRLESLGCRVSVASSGQEGLDLLDRASPQLILLDINLPDMNGLQVLREIRRRREDVPVVMITAYGTIERAVQAMKEGAYDFIPKPFDPQHLEIVIQKALEREYLIESNRLLRETLSAGAPEIIGESPPMLRAVDIARKVAPTNSTVLLLGESGTGKEVFAHAIHNWSERKDEPFIAINCVGLSKDLLESELFGHEKGAFTGAHQLKKGKMELAHGGTVFLDEVGDISAELQTKLLRFLQEREFERVGGNQPIRVDVRVIAATNRDLSSAIKEGRFREDLYYRLNVVPITLPALRERKEDIPTLTRFFLSRFSSEVKKNFTEISPDAQAKLQTHDWPGNVRELANVIERAVVLGQEPMVRLDDLPPEIVGTDRRILPENLTYREALDVTRRQLIQRALVGANGNHTAAAKALGIHRTHLLNLMKALGIE